MVWPESIHDGARTPRPRVPVGWVRADEASALHTELHELALLIGPAVFELDIAFSVEGHDTVGI